jgi:hypothetical protein
LNDIGDSLSDYGHAGLIEVLVFNSIRRDVLSGPLMGGQRWSRVVFLRQQAKVIAQGEQPLE